ncbi:MAG: hypothetical protein RhofKO_25940 [Rhodothermales bacterium]
MSVFTDLVIDLRTADDALERHRRIARDVFKTAGDDAIAYSEKVRRLRSELSSLKEQLEADLKQIQQYKIDGLIDEDAVQAETEKVKKDITGLLEHVRVSVKELTPELTRELTDVLGAAGVQNVTIKEAPTRGPKRDEAAIQAMKEMRNATKLARIEFDALNLANRRGDRTNEEFAEGVEEMTARVLGDLDRIRRGYTGTAEAVEIQFGKAINTLDRFRTRSGEVADQQTRLRTRISQGVRDGLEDLAYRLPGGGMLARGASLGAGALTAGIVGAGAIEGTRRAIAQAIRFEKEMTEVRKTANLTAQATEALGDRILDLSADLGLSSTALAQAAASAGQLGIRGEENIARFSATTVKLAEVSDLTASEASTNLGRIAEAFGLPIEAAENMGSVFNGLSNTTGAAAGEIVNAVLRVGPVAKALGVDMDQVAAVVATLIESGNGVERSGTQMRNILTLLQTKADDVAEVLGVTSNEALNLIQDDAFTTLQRYVGKLGEMPETLASIEIEKTFGRENVSGLQLLVDKSREAEDGVSALSENLAEAAKLYVEGRSLNDEYAQSLDNVSGQARILWERIKAGGIAFGQRFLPAIKDALRGVNDLIAPTRGLIDEYGRLSGRVSELTQAGTMLDRYNELVRTGKTNTAEYRSIVDQLSALFPGYVNGWNSAGEAAGLYADQLARVIAQEKERAVLDQQDNLVEQFSSLGAARAELEELLRLKKRIQDQGSAEPRARIGSGAVAAPAARFDTTEQELARIEKQEQQAIATINNLVRSLGSTSKGAQAVMQDALIASGVAADEAGKMIKQVIRDLKALEGESIGEQIKRLQDTRDGIVADYGEGVLQDHVNTLDEQIKALKEAQKVELVTDPDPDPKAAERAREHAIGQLQAVTRQQELRAATSDAEREALQRLHVAQDELNRAFEVEQSLKNGGTASEQLEAQLARARATQQEAEALRVVMRAREEGDTASLQALTRRLEAQRRLIGLEGEERSALQAVQENAERLVELETQRTALARQRESLDESSPNASALDDQLAAVQALIDAEAGRTDGLQSTLKEVQQMKALYESMPADARRLLDTLGGLEATFGDLTAEQSELIDDFVAAAAEGVARLKSDVGTLRLEYEASDDPEAKAAIRKQIAELVNAANAELRQKLGELLSALPEGTNLAVIAQIESVYRALGGSIAGVGEGITEAAGETGAWADSLDRAARALRTVGQLGNVFGVLTEGTSDLVDGISSVMDNVAELGRVREALQADGGAGLSSTSGLLQQALPVLGVVGGVASAALGLKRAIDARTERSREEARERREEAARQAEAMRELRDQLRENEAALRDNISALIAKDRVGERVTGDQVQGARDALGTVDGLLDRPSAGGPSPAEIAESFLQGFERINLTGIDEAEVRRAYERGIANGLSAEAALEAVINEFNIESILGQIAPEDRQRLGTLLDDARQGFDDAGGGTNPTNPFSNADAVRFFEELAGLGIEDLGVEQFKEQYDLLKEQGKTSADSIQEVLDTGLREAIEALSASLGGFTPTIEGAIERIGFFAKFLGTQGVEAVQSFLDYLLNARDGAGVEGLSNTLRGLLDEIASLSSDGSLDDADRDRIREIYAVIASTIDAGGESALELLGGLSTAQVEALLGQLDGLIGGDASSEGSASRSASFSRGVTEFQADEFVYYLEELVRLVEIVVGMMGGSTSTSAPDTMVNPVKDDGFGDARDSSDFERGLGTQGRVTSTGYQPIAPFDITEVQAQAAQMSAQVAAYADLLTRPLPSAEIVHELHVVADATLDGPNLGALLRMMTDEDADHLARVLSIKIKEKIDLRRGRP